MKSAIYGGVVLAAVANAQSGAWGQCGGINWTGPKTCISGYTCTFSNDWYSQCLPGSNQPTTTPIRTTTTSTTRAVTSSTTVRTTTTRIATLTTPGVTTTTTTTTTKPAATGFIWLGTNEAGAEFGEKNLPGLYGKDFIFPDLNAISTLISTGHNTFRVGFKMERLAQNGVASSFDSAYLANLTSVINGITSRGAWAVVDPHNYGRYRDAVITDTAAFGSFWTKLASVFKDNSKVIFDTNNEYNSMDQSLVVSLNQAAINAIRGAGATSQYIWVEGNQWSGAWSWPDVNDSMKQLTDPENKLIYEMHQYLDSDSSGTSVNCVSGTIGAERLVAATNWLRANGKVGVIGEFAGGANEQCRTAVKGFLDYLKANSDVWKGAVWWAAGPWWGNYMYNLEPNGGVAYPYYNSLLTSYKP